VIWVVAGLLMALGAVSFLLSRCLFHPGTVYASVWAVSVLALGVCGNLFFPVSGYALMLYFVGAVSFVIGTFTVSGSHPLVRESPIESRHARRIFDLLLATSVIGFPVYWSYVRHLVGRAPLSMLFLLARNKEVNSRTYGHLDPVRNLPIIALFACFGLWIENDGTRRRALRAYIGTALALIYSVLLGSKSGFVTICLTVIFISGVRGRLKVRQMLVGLLLGLFGFTAGLVYYIVPHQRNLIGSFEATSIAKIGGTAGKTVLNYWLGGLVAFDRVFADAQAIPATQNPDRFFLETARSLGIPVHIPNHNAEFSTISDRGRLESSVNIYTIYFSYWAQYRWAGVILFPMFIGFVASWFFHRARAGSKIGILFYALLACGIVLSFNGEHFLLGLNEYLKAAFVFCIAYVGPAFTVIEADNLRGAPTSVPVVHAPRHIRE
jgi:hypothetical protein